MYIISFPFLSKEIYTKIENKRCRHRRERYATIEAAQNACTADNNCKGVYAARSPAGFIATYLCPATAAYQTSGNSWIYHKNDGKL